ncbi:MAG: nucleotidyltransferase domain-containing protein [Oscillospiraceae bacterium]|nr:nucleotidyltransferase domain-containing protein [Oscillospiraceae bacterium]
MIYTLDEIKQIVSPIAQNFNIKTIYLFGSYARNEATDTSDIDLIIDRAETEIKSLFQLAEVYCELEKAFNKKIDVITLDSIYQSIQMPSEKYFRENVFNEMISIYKEGSAN